MKSGGSVRVRVGDGEKKVRFELGEFPGRRTRVKSDLKPIIRIVKGLPIEIKGVASRWLVFYFEDYYLLNRVRSELLQNVAWDRDYDCEIQTLQKYADGAWELWVRKTRGRYDELFPTIKEMIEKLPFWEKGIKSRRAYLNLSSQRRREIKQ